MIQSYRFLLPAKGLRIRIELSYMDCRTSIECDVQVADHSCGLQQTIAYFLWRDRHYVDVCRQEFQFSNCVMNLRISGNTDALPHSRNSNDSASQKPALLEDADPVDLVCSSNQLCDKIIY
jgi:hypothetical protein